MNPAERAPGRGVPGLAGAALPATLLLAACAALGPRAPAPIPEPASRAFAEARVRWRGAGRVGGAADGAREAARHALELAPDWIAPRRFLDDLAREDLVAPAALTLYRERLAQRPADAAALYLAGRLEGAGQRFERAVALAPNLAWAHHGRAWRAATDGDLRGAIRSGRRALAMARDPYERATFSRSIARYERSAGWTRAAIETLLDASEDPELAALDRLELALDLAAVEMEADERALRSRGVRRALALFAEVDLTSDELLPLVRAAQRALPSTDLAPGELELALAARAGDLRERLRGELALRERETPLGLELWAGGVSDEPSPGAAELRVARMRFGDPARAVLAWLEELPRAVLRPDGTPRSAALAELVAAARALPPSGAGLLARLDDVPAADLERLGAALIGAGWFREARALAARVPGDRVAWAAELDRRALAGQVAIDSIARRLEAVDHGVTRAPEEPDALPGPGPRDDEPARLAGLSGFLASLAAPLARARTQLLGERTDAAALGLELSASPRIDYGWVGSIVHPGPSFSAQDERLGRGPRGEPVPGLAAELARLGRFGLFGDAIGSPPDGALLRIVGVEWREGTHLGAPFAGTAAWCDGADVPPRVARAGASIAGAALHEGFWIDLDVVRRDHASWERLRRRFSGPDGAERVARALAVAGVPASDATSPARSSERPDRARIDAPLGEADRLRLAVLAQRAAPGEGLGNLPLDELLAATVAHEEGHLCDRARFYPIGEHPFAALGLFARAGFVPSALAQLLEYRAQLVALCVAADPRVPLVDLAAAAEVEGREPTPHGAAYRALLGDFLLELDHALAEARDEWPELDPGRRLVHQLHRLGPESIRSVAIRLAGRQGLVGRAEPPGA